MFSFGLSLARPQWRMVAVGVVSELLILGGTSLANTFQPGARQLDLAGYLLLAVGAASVAFAAGWPLPAFVVALASTAGFYSLDFVRASPMFLTVLAVLFLASTPAHVLRSGLMGLATFAAVVASGLMQSNRGGLNAVTFTAAGWIAAAILAGHAVSAQRAYIASMRDRAQRAEETRELEARRRVAEERLRIARDLHDIVSHTISVINVQAGVAAHVLDRRPEQVRPALDAITSSSRQALTELRGMLHVLRQVDGSDSRQPAPGLGDLEALVESSRQAGISTALSMAAEADLLPPGVQLAAYRIVQESLTNAVRYAQGSSVTVRLCCQGGQLVVDVSDTGGRLGDARAGSTLGITGMRERAAAVGGTLEAGPRPEGGFRVLARLPAAP